jgi:hypothetical protein
VLRWRLRAWLARGLRGGAGGRFRRCCGELIWRLEEGLKGWTHSNGLVSFWGTFPTVAILVKAGACPIGGGGVVLPWSAGSKRSGAGILSQNASFLGVRR